MRFFLWLAPCLVSLLICLSDVHAATKLTVQLSLNWEGRKLQQPNIDALQRLRQAFPAIPLNHLINPVYFLDSQNSDESQRLIHENIQSQDELGLYLSSAESLIRKSAVVPKLSPTFWGYFDEGEFCKEDCGLDVPLTVYNREDVLKIFITAHQTMKDFGFTQLQSLAVRGWLDVPFLGEMAAVFGYRFDLSPVDPLLVAMKLQEFPISQWVASSWGELRDPKTLLNLSLSGKTLDRIPQAGGILELNEQQQILQRFDRIIKLKQENPANSSVFSLSMSSESFFQTWPKLRFVLQSMQERAKNQDVELEFSTPSMTKSARPISENMRISTKL